MKLTTTHLAVFILTIGLFSSNLRAQEVCGNGVDDDADGLIDLFDPDCQDSYDCVIQGVEQDFDLMAPMLHCSALLSAPSAYSSPVTADVDNDGDAEVIVINYSQHELLIISGIDCSVEATISFPVPSFGSKSGNAALGDVDSDGYIDIFIAHGTGGADVQSIKRIEFDGVSYQEIWDSPGSATADRKHLDILDVNQDGVPEIIPNGGFMVNSITGVPYSGALPAIDDDGKGLYAYSADADTGNNGNEGDVELIRGMSIFRYDFVANSWNLIRDVVTHSGTWNDETKTSVADLDLDGDIDAVVTNHSTGSVLVWDLQSTNVVAETSFGGAPGIGRASIGNFDDDPEPEFTFVRFNSIEVLDDIVNSNAGVSGFDNLWSLSVVDLSAQTQVSLFDFDADGKKEIVYRGESELYVYRGGADVFGNVQQIYSSGNNSITSETGIEYPVIADVTGDGQANIITIGDNNGSLGQGLHIFKSSGNPWAGSKAIWNTQAYVPTMVNDNGTIPQQMQENYLIYNDYNAQHAPYTPLEEDESLGAELSMTVASGSGNNGIIYDNCPDFGLAVELCNAGDVATGNNLIIEVYDGDAYTDAIAEYITSISFNTLLAVDECVTDTIYFTPNVNTDYDFHFYVNHNNTTGNIPVVTNEVVRNYLECDYSNNTLIHSFSCNREPDLLDDSETICANALFSADVLANDTDPDNNIDISTLTISTGPNHGVANVVSGQIEYTSSEGFSGLDSLEYTVSDLGIPIYTESAWIVFTVQEANDAGTSTSVDLCESSSPVNLLSLLGGSPDSGGSWVGGLGNNHASTFDPSFESSQTLTYSFSGVAACNVPSTVDITVIPSPSAGTGGDFEVCSSDSPFSMLILLTGTDDPLGQWYDFNDLAVSSVFSPGVTADGDYYYVIPPNGSCPADSAFVNITTETQLSAGNDSTLDLCENAGMTNLFVNLAGSPNGGGFWEDENGNIHSGTLDPSLLESGEYSYVISATSACPQNTAVLDVNISSAPETGSDGTLMICETASAESLFDLLGGNPQAGGYWTNPLGDPHSGIFDPATDTPGIYTYSIDSGSPCFTESSEVSVQVSTTFSAGENASVQFCSSDATQDILPLLAGTPDVNGTWSLNGTNLNINSINPSTDVSGIYTYTVPANGGCSSLNAELTVTISDAANAGDYTSTAICSDQGVVDLTSLLNGTPQTGGNWYDGAANPISNLFNTSFSGNYSFRYEILGIGACAGDDTILELEVQQQLNPGSDQQIEVCENTNPLDLTSYLSSNADSGGSWIAPDLSGHTDIFDPSTDSAGIYGYVLNSPAACVNPQADIEVIIENMPDAGTNGGSSFFCDVYPGFDLISDIPGTPQTDGYFTDPNGDLITDFSSSASYISGLYTYHANPINVCPETTSLLDVTISSIGSAGVDTEVLLCDNSVDLNLTELLDGSPTPGGLWIDENNNPISEIYTPSNPVTLTYQRNGGFPCPTITSELEITLSPMTEAGNGAVISSCEIDATFDLELNLAPSATSNGYWQSPSGTVLNNTLIDPDISEQGDYLYLTNPAASCPQDTAVFVVITQNLPNAGEDGFLLVCSISNPVPLTDFLEGSPDPDGIWIAPDNTLTDEIFDPNANGPGQYTYEVAGTFPCPTTAATASVDIVDAPNAGDNVDITLCSTDDSINLEDYITAEVTPETRWENENGDTVNAPVENPSDGLGSEFLLIANGETPCPSDTAWYSFTVNLPVELNQTQPILLCNESSPVDLNDFLSIDNAETYEFLDSDLNIIGNIFDPAVYADESIWVRAYPYAPCIADSLEIEVTINTPSNPGTDTLVNVCTTDVPFSPFDMIAGSPDVGGSFVWMNDTSSSISFDPSMYSGSHFIEYISHSLEPCPDYSSWLQVDIYNTPDPEFSINDEEAQLSNPIFYFENETEGLFNFTWDFGGLGQSNAYDTEFTFPEDITEDYLVCLEASNNVGCEAITCELIEVKDILSYFIPNSFTPNGDGDNDIFYIRGRGIDEDFFELYIYSRNGDQVYYSKDRSEGWDGTWFGELVPTDMYSYRVVLKAEDTSDRKEIMGNINVLR